MQKAEDIREIERRIAAARRFKAATGGAYVDDAAMERALEAAP